MIYKFKNIKSTIKKFGETLVVKRLSRVSSGVFEFCKHLKNNTLRKGRFVIKVLIKKSLSFVLTLLLVMGTNTTIFAQKPIQYSKSGISIEGRYYTEEEFKEFLEDIELKSSPTISSTIMPRMAFAIPAWALGEWLIPIAGTFVVVTVTPYVIKVGNQVIDTTSTTFTNILNAIKQSKKSDKEKANDVPSWVRGKKPKEGEDGKSFAKRVCDEKYGKGNYNTGPGSEYNKIRKWGDRGFK